MGKSLSEQILDIANKPINEDIDIENEDVAFRNEGDSDSQVSDVEDEESETVKGTGHYVSVGKSKLRNEVKDVVTDAKYTGQKGSRADLYSDGNDDDADENEGESDAMSFVTDSEDQEVSADDDEEEENDNEEAEEEEDEDQELKRERLTRLVNQETKKAISGLSQGTKRDAAKGLSILKQNRVFESTIDVRIKLQKALSSANLLPLTRDSWDVYLANDNKTIKLLEKTNKKLNKVFNKLVSFRTEFQLNDHITTEESDNTDKKRSYTDLVEETDRLDNSLKEYRDAVLNKWSIKIASASGNTALNATKFQNINQSADIQVNNQLADLPRLIKRTCLNRRNTQPLNFNEDLNSGKLSHIKNSSVENAEDDGEDNIDIPSNYDPRRKNNTKLDTSENPYIFDDEDFYRVLLNDLVDKKISNAQNLQSNGANIAITSRSNNKLKKNIDTKASKGRKLNYSVQESIANYEAPANDGYKWSDEHIDEFFAGLFGQKINFEENENEDNNKEDSENHEQDEQVLEAIKNDEIQIFG
ncbi:hypothetical protein TPHA_0D01880 [Tetrapisispora phaffii CBS 4417]|uniref:Protein BFR2 n=1 Tax=Tetrapisispora phaffii (strain ATCC 24235 / CBS 4417 / NBRC 1672 / NRRL Y-8282 / UCD 70-5) TaxID=1071381 RepID=G8BSK6_TETPH|nr:hypothetical protein TPHA_0D01880 [Tetrapisispora phaffii CBS 4417]CCE62827.1 hypothetical protein TPHA_0D01880 [Tetrapisispora phaffii CBS 4417]